MPLKANVPEPHSPEAFGFASFDYESWDGWYEFGEAPHSFRVRWSGDVDGRIHVYRHDRTVVGLAIAPGVAQLRDLTSKL